MNHHANHAWHGMGKQSGGMQMPFIPIPMAMFGMLVAFMFGAMFGMLMGKKQHAMMPEWKHKMGMGMGWGKGPHHHHGEGSPACWARHGQMGGMGEMTEDQPEGMGE